MSYNLIWIFLLILHAFVTSLPIQDRYDLSVIGINQKSTNTSPELPKYEDALDSGNEQVISVRITSSVAVGRGKEKLPYRPPTHKHEPDIQRAPSKTVSADLELTTLKTRTEEATPAPSDLSTSLQGANIEYIKQLNAKKDYKDHNAEQVHPFQRRVNSQQPNENESSQSESTTIIDDYDENIEDIPTARKVPSMSDANRFHEDKEHRSYQHDIPIEFHKRNGVENLTTDSSDDFGLKLKMDDNKSAVNESIKLMVDQNLDKKEIRDINEFVSSSNNYHSDDSVAESSIKSVEFTKTTASVPLSATYMHSISHRPLTEEQNNPRLTTVSFNIVHDATKTSSNSEPSNPYVTTSQVVSNQQQFYDSSKTQYSQPAQIYSEPSKFYSEPAKIYSEPAKIYSVPAKVYSEPAKIYSEPAKFYSEPASLHLNENVPSVPPSYTPWPRQPQRPSSTSINTTPITMITNGYRAGNTRMDHQPERNYEVDEKVSVLTDGRSHGVQESSTEKCKQDNCKVGYVVEGRQYKKYRVEERTADGFIVGEYGVVRNEDGALRGVRYTADSDASPRLIHDALMKFLQLK